MKASLRHWRIVIAWWAISIPGCLFLVSCDPPRPAPPPEISDCSQTPTAPQVDIYHDVTESMEGFLRAGADGPYTDFLELVERAATSAWRNPPTLYKFGTTVEQLASRQERFSLAAYVPRPGYVDNDYRVVVAHDAVNHRTHLKVIVTDLFQSDDDFDAVSEAIVNTFFGGKGNADGNVKTGKGDTKQTPASAPGSTLQASAPPTGDGAVGILAIKLPFKGYIFDFGRTRKNFFWNGNRPIYLVILGERSYVVRYLSSLDSELKRTTLGPAKSLLLSPVLVQCLPKLNALKLTQVNNLDQIETLMTLPKHPLVKQVRIARGAERAEFTLSAPLELLPNAAGTSVTQVVPYVQVQKARTEGPEGFDMADEALDTAHATASVQNSQKNGSVLKLTISLDPTRLQKGKIYRFGVSVGPDRQKIQMPSWIEEWSIRATAKPDGEKTLNLNSFLWSLWNGINSDKNPELLHGYFYVRRD